MGVLQNLWIIPALPLLGAAVNGLLGPRFDKKTVNAVGVGSTTLTFLAALAAIWEFSRLPASQVPFVKAFFPWMVAGNFRVDFALQVDQLTVVMQAATTASSPT
jgi:NADH-quinone oxidoreductase subunit L